MADGHSKVCRRCGKLKPFTEFAKAHERTIGGVGGKCKPCMKILYREKYGFSKSTCWLDKTCILCGITKPRSAFENKKDSFDGKGNRCGSCKGYASRAKADPIQQRAYHKEYRQREERKRRERERKMARRQNPTHRISKRMSEGIRKSLGKNKTGSWLGYVDYTPDELRAHIERQFTKGMTWVRFNKGEIHIDHIIPQSAFNYDSPDDEDFKKCWCLSNLRPCWATDNLSKGANRVYLL